MLSRVETLKGYRLHTSDGASAGVNEFYFDDRHWTIRYLVAYTGNWLTGRQVLICTPALGAVNSEGHNITIDLTEKQVEESPSVDSAKPVSRQSDDEVPPQEETIQKEPTRDEKAGDPHLRSTGDVIGHQVHAADGEVGHVEDFIIDDEPWAIRYLIIDTGNWWPGKRVLISPHWIERVSWEEKTVFVNLSRDAIKGAPEYTNKSLLVRGYEAALYRHYNRPAYWGDATAAKAAFPPAK